ncbi:MAG: MFS transporter [Steroidobacteraceae bacterium]|jgi:MFS family permease
MSESATQPQSLSAHRPFLFYVGARSGAELATQIAAVAIGWQVYALTHSALALGLVGLVQFLPTLLLTFLAGHVADHFDRRRIVQLTELTCAATSLLLAWGSYAGWLTSVHLFIAVAVFGTAEAFESPAIAALLPAVAPIGQLQRATAVATGAFQVAMISGPALGGLAAALSPATPYVLMTACSVLAALLTLSLPRASAPAEKPAPDLSSVFAGVSFVRCHPAILGTISLDLFAVLLGGATALLPIYARDILHTGAWGLGMLRSAPALGALLMSAVLARHAIERRAGMRMFQAVIVFGLATIVFALSRSFWLSMLALLVLGAADSISMVIRIALVQLATPDDMRGRVGAVNYLFVNASNQLGQFESGATAALFGAMPAALIGGIGTVLVALLWMKLFPALRTLERLE